MIRNIQALRFVFIFVVVVSHLIGKSFDSGGECGVSFFFILSGFILSWAYGGKVSRGEFQSKPFIQKQLLKFYPLHVLMFVILATLDYRLGQGAEWYKLLANLLLLQSWVPADSFYFVANGSSWFLCDILFFYVIFAALYRAINGWSRKTLLTVGLLVTAVYLGIAFTIPAKFINPIMYASPLMRALDFALGIVVCRFYRSEAGQRLKNVVCRQSDATLSILEIGWIAWFVLAFLIYDDVMPSLRCTALFAVFTVPFLLHFIAADSRGGIVTRLLHSSVMQWLGGISLEIYLTHWGIMRIFYSFLLHRWGIEDRLTPTILPITIALIIGGAWLTKILFVDKIYNKGIKYVAKS